MNRKSIRTFLDKKLDEIIIQQLLEAGMQAPSAHNQQPWEFIVVDEPSLLKNMSTMSNGARLLENAPLAIVTMMRPSDKSPLMRPQDMSASTQNILLRAVELGLGGVWIGVFPLEERMNHVSEIFGIKGETVPFSIIALGYPKEDRELVKRYDQSRIHHNKWNN